MKFCKLIDLQRMNNFKTIFVKNKKYEHGGLLKVKIHILLCEDKSWTTALKTNHVWHSKSSRTYLQVVFEPLFYLMKLLNMAMVQIFAVKLGQTPNHCVQNSVILCNILACFLWKGSWGLWDHNSRSVSPLQLLDKLRNLVGRSCCWRWPRSHCF
jgi:hypothetical protein